MLEKCSRRNFILMLVGIASGKKALAAPTAQGLPTHAGLGSDIFVTPLVDNLHTYYPQLVLARGHSFSEYSWMYSPYTFEVMPCFPEETQPPSKTLRECLKNMNKVEVTRPEEMW